MSTKVLFIGGTGLISAACTDLAAKQGIELYLLNRGKSTYVAPKGVQELRGDIYDPESVKSAIGARRFDCIVDWIAYDAEHLKNRIDLFKGRTSQFIFISSASVYRKPPGLVPVTESTFAANSYWPYSRNKIACEELLINEFRASGFPATIVRPSHTYDRMRFPWFGGWTVIDRMQKGKKVIVPGDGTSLWTLTHHIDFAKAFNGLLGNPNAVGEVFHITSDEALTWNRIHQVYGDILGLEVKFAPVPSEVIIAHNPNWSGDLLGDKSHCMVFDNSKIKRFVPGFAATIPYSEGAQQIVDWHLADPSRQKVDTEMDALFDRIIAAQARAYEV
jgi:nucleoside-diphosphate-sugar epimerase